MIIKLKNIFSNSYLQSAFVGALVTLMVYSIWDEPIKRYKVKVDPFDKYTTDEVLWFIDDFDGDGNSERIRCFNAPNAKTMDLVAYDTDGNLLDHYHYPGYNWSYRLFPKVFDINDDGIQELLYFDERNDSIFFNAVNLKDYSLQIDHHFFHKIERHRDNYAFQSFFYELSDLDGNGIKELLFSFNAGFGLYPRGIFKMEFPSLKVTSSPTEHMVLNFDAFADLDSDKTPEILLTSSAPCNSYHAEKYADTCSYLLALDWNLEPIFEPLKMSGNYSYVHCIPSCVHDSLFFALHWSRSNAQNPAKVMVVNSTGKILKSKEWNKIKHPENTDFDLCILNNEPFLVIRNVGRFKLNTQLSNLPNSGDLHQPINNVTSPPFRFDFNNDGTDEFVLWDMHANIQLINEKTNESLSFRSPIPLRWGLKIYPYLENNKVTQYACTSLGGFFFLRYQKNTYYFTLYLIYLFVFLSTAGLIFTILFYQKRTIEKRLQTEKQLSELQFNSVKNQLNPHFLFNALNSVAFMINEGKKEEAYDFLAVNSRMIQRVMNDANEVKRPLKDEIRFTKDYLSIQKHRFKNRFEANFTIDENVDQLIEIPKMCIHTYVENAIKHGFRNTKTGGVLNINIKSYQKNGISIRISDNGMGRKSAAEYKDSSGNGINIMNKFYRLFEKYHAYKIDFSIGDNVPVGTVVELKIVLLHKN